jgi:hypothetical protein
MCLTAPDLELDVILIANRGDAPVQPLAFEVLDACLDGLPPSPKGLAGSIPTGVFWCDETASLLEVAEEADQVVAKFGDMKLPMRRDGEGRIVGELSIVDLTVSAIEGDPDSVTVDFRGSCDLYRSLPPGTDDPLAEAARWVGTYLCKEAQARAEVAIDGERMSMRMSGPFGRDTYDLKRVAPLIWTSHLGDTGFGGSVELAVSDGGAVTGFAVTTARTRRLPFERVV